MDTENMKKGKVPEFWQDEISQAASLMGKKGGSVKSEKKARAARENGKKGGRPRKNG